MEFMELNFGFDGLWITAICAFLISLYFLKRVNKRRVSPPGPIGLPLVGYLPFTGKHAASTFYELSIKYGPVISVDLALDEFLILNDYDSIHEALIKHAGVFSGRPTYPINMNSKEPGKQEGISCRDLDEICKVQRKFAITTLKSFGFGKRSMEDKISEEMKFFIDLIQSKEGEPFDCRGALAATVSNVIWSIVLGQRFSYDDKVFSRMIEKLNRAFSDEKHALGLTAINMLPALRYIPPLSSIYKEFQNDVRFIEETLQKMIDEHRKNINDEEPRDFIVAYLQEMKRRENIDPSFNEKQLLHVLRDFFVAGSETTSSTLRWIVLLFANRPDIQRKVAEEINEIIGDATPSLKHRDELPYTCAFLLEITRHRTLLPLSLAHKTTADTIFRGYRIAKNTKVFPNLWAVHNDPTNFEDPSEFRPERFINKAGKFVPDKRVIPFCIGPRYCLGEQVAKMELFLFLTNIVQKFNIVPNPNKPLPSFYASVPGVAEVPLPFEVSFIARQ